MERLLLALGIVAVVAVIALVMRRRRDDAPTQVQHSAPQQLDRADFVGDTDWVLVPAALADRAEEAWRRSGHTVAPAVPV